jgi:beta-glucosidase
VISGKINPSGRLASTFPIKYPDVPSAKNFPGVVLESSKPQAGAGEEDAISVFRRPRASRIVYAEGIYVGYRYYETFRIKPAYEFGYGLSYTSFEYSGLALSSQKFSAKITATVTVKNSGQVAGREVVQLYLRAPAGRLSKPALELKGFAKTRLLQPGESQNLSFDLVPRNLSSFDPASSSWIAEAGTYEVKIGASSRDTRQTALFELDADLTVKKENIALVPQVPIEEFKPVH